MHTETLSKVSFEFINKLVTPLKLLIVAGISVTLALSFRFFWVGPPPGVSQSPIYHNSAPQNSLTDVEAAIRLHPFGNPHVGSTLTPDVRQLQQTKLNLVLRAVILNEANMSLSKALISGPQPEDAYYKIGDMLPGNAQLTEIYSNRVIIRRYGVDEQLSFSKGEPLLSNAKQDERSAANDENNHHNELANIVLDYQTRFTERPKEVLSEMGLKVVSPGTAQGYRLTKSPNNTAIEAMNLQVGDVVLSVNGQKLGDLQNDQRLLKALTEEGSIEMEVQRGSRRFLLKVPL